MELAAPCCQSARGGDMGLTEVSLEQTSLQVGKVVKENTVPLRFAQLRRG